VNGECTGACQGDSDEDNDLPSTAKVVMWSNPNGPFVSLNPYPGYLCAGDADYYLLDTMSLGIMDPVLSLYGRAKGSHLDGCNCDGCGEGVCAPRTYPPPGPQSTLTIEVYNATTLELLAVQTSELGEVEIGAYGTKLNQNLLIKVYGPAAAQYPYTFGLSFYENWGEEGECEC
jgi:hypothetical protein